MVQTFCLVIRVSNYPFRSAFVIETPFKLVMAQLPDIAMHIVKTPGIWSKAVNRDSIFSEYPYFIIIVRVIPIIVCLFGSNLKVG